MTRSVNTLATVVITLVALLAFGGASLQNFAFALLVGICSGGYHSIFYSAPLVYILRERSRRRPPSCARSNAPRALERPRTVAEARAQARSECRASRSWPRAKSAAAARSRRPRAHAGRPGALSPQAPASQTPAEAAAAKAPACSTTTMRSTRRSIRSTRRTPGMHEHELTLGHEEIHLNLEDEDEHAVTTHGAVEGESPAPAKRD